MHHQIQRPEGPTGLQRSHGVEFILSPPRYLLLGSFFVPVVVPASWGSGSLLGRVPSRVLGWSVPRQPGPQTWVQVVGARPPPQCRSRVWVSTLWIPSPLFRGKGWPGAACSHKQLMLSVLATRLDLWSQCRKSPKGQKKTTPKPCIILGAGERSRNWKEIVRREG